MKVKRQIWQIDEKLFREYIFPLLNQFINDEDLNFWSNEMFLVQNAEMAPLPPRKRRAANTVLQVGDECALVDACSRVVGRSWYR